MNSIKARNPSGPLAGRIVRFLLRHWPLGLLLLVTAAFAAGTADVYLWSEDL